MSTVIRSHTSTPNKIKEKNLMSLNDIVSMPEKKQSTVGVILDATGRYKTDNSFDYVCKIKIVDNSYNPLSDNVEEKAPFVQVFIFSSKLKDSPVVRKIGDVVLLRNFSFDNYKDTVKGVYRKSASEWYLFDGNNATKPISGSKSQIPLLTNQEKKSIVDCQRWANHFFQNNSLEKLCWYRNADGEDIDFPEEVDANKVYELEDVDLIVRVVCVIQCYFDQIFYHKVVFADRFGRKYLSEIRDSGLDLKKNQVVKLRSVHLISTNNQYRVDFYDYSDILLLQDNFKDVGVLREATANVTYSENLLEKQFLEEFHLDKYERRTMSNNTVVFQTKKTSQHHVTLSKFSKQFPIMNEFYYDDQYFTSKKYQDTNFEDLVGSVINKKHQLLPNRTFKELKGIKKESEKSNKIFANKYQGELFRVSCTMTNVHHTTLKKTVQLYDDKKKVNHQISDLPNLTKKEKKDLKAIFFNIFTLEQGKDTLQAYLASFDENPKFVFDLWNLLPEMHDVEAFAKKSKAFTRFEKSMKNMTKRDLDYELVLQLVKNAKGALFFRIIDTMFWFNVD